MSLNLIILVNILLLHSIGIFAETPSPWPISCPCSSSSSSSSDSSSSDSSSPSDSEEHDDTCQLFPILATTGGQFSAIDAGFPFLIDPNLSDSVWRSLRAVEQAAIDAEFDLTRRNVGLSGNPDSTGKVTNDAMIMYGPTHDGASVAFLDNILPAVSAARGVLHYSRHSFIVGDGAESFVLSTQLTSRENTTIDRALVQRANWLANNCQGNPWRNFNDSTLGCPDETTGSYFEPLPLDRIEQDVAVQVQQRINRIPNMNDWELGCDFDDDGQDDDSDEYEYDPEAPECDHDTIGVIGIDEYGYMSISESTNGLRNKMRGRVADSPIIGSGGYVKQGVGACVSTGNGDVIQRFAPAKYGVTLMDLGIGVFEASQRAVVEIAQYYNQTAYTLACMDACGNFGCGGYSRNREGTCALAVRNTGNGANYTVAQNVFFPRVTKLQNQTWEDVFPKLKAVLV